MNIFVLVLKCRCLIHVSTVAFLSQIHRTDSGKTTEGSPKGSTGGQKALWKCQNFIQKSQNLGIELVKNFKMGKKNRPHGGRKKSDWILVQHQEKHHILLGPLAATAIDLDTRTQTTAGRVPPCLAGRSLLKSSMVSYLGEFIKIGFQNK